MLKVFLAKFDVKINLYTTVHCSRTIKKHWRGNVESRIKWEISLSYSAPSSTAPWTSLGKIRML